MPIMTWNSALDIGIEKMNGDHREILDAMNAIYDAHEAGKKGAAIDRLVQHLGEVCRRHFADEETYMAGIGFPELGTHKRIHATLLADFGRHAAVIRQAGGIANADFFGFLKRWLAAHIKGIDTRYASHARASAA